MMPTGVNVVGIDEHTALILDLGAGICRVMGKGGAERVGYLAEQTAKLVRQYLRERGTPKAGPLFESRQGRLGYAMARAVFRKLRLGGLT